MLNMVYISIAAWGNYTSGGPLVFGRNYDNGPKLAEFVSVVVYNPEDGSITRGEPDLYRGGLCDHRHESGRHLFRAE